MKTFLTAGAAAVAMAVSMPAHAQLAYLGNFKGNECGKGGFSNCVASQNGLYASSAIIKFNPNGSVGDTSSHYPTVTGSDFTFLFNANANTLNFTYAPDAGDPSIHYFAIKQSNGYALFYDKNPILSSGGPINLSTYFPRNPGLSHVTFFNGSVPAVPEPATWAMMLLGFGGIGASIRRAHRTGARLLQVA
jgi:hypothetical protein